MTTAFIVATAVLEHYIMLIDIPNIIAMNKSSQFESMSFAKICVLLVFKPVTKSSFAHRVMSKGKRFNKRLIARI